MRDSSAPLSVPDPQTIIVPCGETALHVAHRWYEQDEYATPHTCPGVHGFHVIQTKGDQVLYAIPAQHRGLSLVRWTADAGEAQVFATEIEAEIEADNRWGPGISVSPV